ncbi:MAG TPA: tripartite tricarboxylate transporter substrate-binding protein [Burkholderiales bacterium]|nr:tripartite tricarboxylate transporter substrate-binding protein [Burkholderiales bacterium]
MRHAATVLAVVSAISMHAHAQQFPSKPIRIVAGAAPGGGVDTTSRIIAQNLQEHLGQPGVVENRAGAGGSLAGEVAARAAADGHTLATISISYALLPTTHKNLSWSPQNDLTTVTVMVNAPNVLVSHPSLPVKSIKELIAYARTRPGQIDYASSGTSSPSHLATEYLGLLAKVKFTHVPYKGTGPGITDLMAGRVSLMFASIISTRQHVEAGKLRVLATAGAKRAAAAPEVPTIAEAGVPGYAVDVWYAMFAPSATPRPVLERLNGAVSKILHSPDVAKKLGTIGLEPVGRGLAESDAYIKSEIKKWAAVAKAANITPN